MQSAQTEVEGETTFSLVNEEHPAIAASSQDGVADNIHIPVDYKSFSLIRSAENVKCRYMGQHSDSFFPVQMKSFESARNGWPLT